MAILFLSLLSAGQAAAQTAQANHEPDSRYFTAETVTLGSGASLEKVIISGPPKPPAGYEVERAAAALPEPDQAMGIKTLTVPAYQLDFRLFCCFRRDDRRLL